MFAAVTKLTNNVAAFTRNAADATSLLAQGTLAGAQQITQSATLAGRAISQKLQNLWVGNDWIKFDAFDGLQIRHSEDLFIPMKQLAEGPMLPGVEPFVVQSVIENLVYLYESILRGNSAAQGWTNTQWLEFFNGGGPGSTAFAYFRSEYGDLVPYDRLSDVFARTKISGPDMNDLYWVLSEPPYDRATLSPAQVFQMSLHRIHPPAASVQRALEKFPLSMDQFTFLAPDGSKVTLQQLIDGPIYPRVEEVVAWSSQPRGAIPVGQQYLIQEGFCSAERAQYDMVIYRGLRPSPTPAPLPQAFPDSTGKLWTLSDLERSADRSQFPELVALQAASELTHDCWEVFSPESFPRWLDHLRVDYPQLKPWIDQLNYQEFASAFAYTSITDDVIYAKTIAFEANEIQLLNAIRALSPADQIRWFVAAKAR